MFFKLNHAAFKLPSAVDTGSHTPFGQHPTWVFSAGVNCDVE
jgi:hypothetical protein